MTPMNNPVSRRAFVTWLEGVGVTAEGTIYFSDVLGDRIYRLDADACIPQIMREKANFPNGQVIDNDGRLITCESRDSRSGAPPRVTRTDLRTGKSEVLFNRFEGRRLLGPNDVRIDHFGRLYVTDGQRPPFLPELQAEDLPAGYRAPVDTVGVYRLDTDGTVVRILAAPAVSQPNGLGVSADGKTLSSTITMQRLAADEGLSAS